MKQEKIILLQTSRSVKIIAEQEQSQDGAQLEVNVLIKEANENNFHPPIGITHPKYWKLRKLPVHKSRILQIQYSGLSNKEIRKAMKEFGKGLYL
ncbi:hypothetical protein [Dyadobacter sp. NIV53]|uniref:hypothetical protein n=1 Tax=Dyadobacter sp. NIV53 TaxID=2861765 RepID=UPI001C8734B1|nr:hypothetical protein [Dyadobacter sp. NIV53]